MLIKGKSIIDGWSIIHITAWFTLGANARLLNLSSMWLWLTLIISTVLWEISERTFLSKSVVHSESLLNSFVGDPIVNGIGFWLGVKYVEYLIQ